MCCILGGFAVEEEVNKFLPRHLRNLFSYCKKWANEAGQRNISYGYEWVKANIFSFLKKPTIILFVSEEWWWCNGRWRRIGKDRPKQAAI